MLLTKFASFHFVLPFYPDKTLLSTRPSFWSQAIPALDPVKEAQLNRELIDAVLKAESGELKQASSAGSKMIRRRIRENGFSRRILPPSVVSDSQLTRLPDTEYPAVVELRTYTQDLRQVTTDNALKDIQTEEDSRFINTADEIVGAVGGVGEAGGPSFKKQS